MKTWQKIAAEELGESFDGETLLEAVKELRRLIHEQGKPNISYEDDQDFLVKFLRTCKLNTQRAFKMINNYYQNRATYSSKVMPRGRGPRDVDFYAELQTLTILKRKNHDGSTVVMFRKGLWEPSEGKAVKSDMLWLGMYLLEWAIREPEVQVRGITFVYDSEGFGFKHLPYLDLAVFQFLISCINNSYPMRVKAIHVVNVSTPFRFVLNFVTQFLSTKVRGRLHVHTSRETLQNYIDPLALPLEYSSRSQEGSFDNSWLFNELCQLHDWFVERSYFGVQKIDRQDDLKRTKTSWFS